jgi:endonuclease/exonuclease/phosphatase family metal-dependent hydrolase
MKTISRSVICILLTLVSAAISDAAAKESRNLNLATFNIRYGTPKDTGVRSWEARKSACVKCIRDFSFDVVGIQEAVEHQQKDLKEMLPEYVFEFAGRNDGTKGEAVGIGYRKDRFRMLESGKFWLSPTPDVPSNAKEWGGPERHRIAIWMKLEDLRSGERFYYLSTHLEVGGANANVRSESASLIIQKEKEINKEGLPFFVVGDLNPIGQTEEMLLKFRRYFKDSYYLAYDAGCLYGPVGTYNGFNPDADLSKVGKKGDYIFCKGAYTFRKYEAITRKYDGQYPSDHIAVMISVTL